MNTLPHGLAIDTTGLVKTSGKVRALGGIDLRGPAVPVSVR
jgi:hypothetical protein